MAQSEPIAAHVSSATDARGADPLPVLRIRYADPQETWLYLDPKTGGVVQRSEKVTRLKRWLSQGLHSLDFPFLYYRRDAVTCGNAGGRASGCACPYGRRVPVAFVPEAQVTPFALL